MNKTAIAALTLVVAALPLAPAALASDRHESRERHEAQYGWRDGGHYGHDHHGYRDERWHPYWHNGRRYWHDHAEWRHRHHDHHDYRDESRARIVGPVPSPVPPLPVIVLDKQRHGH